MAKRTKKQTYTNEEFEAKAQEMMHMALSMTRLHLLVVNAVDERGDVFGPPDRGAGAELDGLGITPGAAALPPGTFADRKDGENLRQTEKSG